MKFVSLQQVMVGTGYFAVPDYQRDYEWKKEQNSTLLEDIFSLVEDDSRENHFFGAIVTVPYDINNSNALSIKYEDYGVDIEDIAIKHIVDGQQRLTSFSLLCMAIRDRVNPLDDISPKYKERITDSLKPILQGSDYLLKDDITPCSKLALNGNTGKAFLKLLIPELEIDVDNRLKGARRLSSAYEFFYKSLEEKESEVLKDKLFDNLEEYYKKLVDLVIGKLNFVEIECAESVDAFQVFDSLNGKGLDLTAADRIKNIFISWDTSGDAVNKWDAIEAIVGEDNLTNLFTTLFFWHCEQRIGKNKLPDKFRKNYQESAQSDFNYFYNDLYKSAKIYSQLRNSETPNKELNELLSDFKDLRIEQVYVPLFSVISYFGDDIYKNKEMIEFAKVLLTLFVRMQVAEMGMNKLDTLFSSCIKAMRSQSASLELVKDKIANYCKTNIPDDIFKAQFVNFAPKNNDVSKFYMRSFETYCRLQSRDRNPVSRLLSLEHIIPQKVDYHQWCGNISVPLEISDNLKETVIERIGNKALLHLDDNASANARLYPEKLGVYKNGKKGQSQGNPINTFRIIKELVDDYPNQFTHIEIEKRSRKLAEYAVKIWKV